MLVLCDKYKYERQGIRMHWTAPTERDTATDTLEKRLWNAADQFRANSGLTAAQYSAPVLGLIFLLFAETRFAQLRTQLESAGASSRRASSRADEPAAYHAESVIFLPQAARFGAWHRRAPAGRRGPRLSAARVGRHHPHRRHPGGRPGHDPRGQAPARRRRL